MSKEKIMFRPAIMALASATFLTLAPSMPVAAQQKEQLLIVYGEDPCPPSSGEDIVVCARKPESERYRIPERFREAAPGAESASWADRARSIEYVGRTGTNSCSAVGAGGWTGCYSEMLRQAREDRKAKRSSDADVP
jgi:hypothetical protein